MPTDLCSWEYFGKGLVGGTGEEARGESKRRILSLVVVKRKMDRCMAESGLRNVSDYKGDKLMKIKKSIEEFKSWATQR